MRAERWARCLVVLLVVGLTAAALAARWPGGTKAVEMHARLAEAGGWTPATIQATVGQPLHLRLTSDDVMHGFAVGQKDWAPIDVKPGVMSDVTLTFDRPGTYTFYCTRWCGLDHWRMRGTIEVRGPVAERSSVKAAAPLYVSLGLDLDAPHAAGVVPSARPSASRGAAVAARIGVPRLAPDAYRTESPAQRWQALRRRAPASVSDMDVWDVVAFEWRSATTPVAVERGRALYAANCAACHGEHGRGDGVMAPSLARFAAQQRKVGRHGPANFTDARSMLGASPAVLRGKIVRGGMGTGMPSWGAIFTEADTWALADFLWTFEFGDTPNTVPARPR